MYWLLCFSSFRNQNVIPYPHLSIQCISHYNAKCSKAGIEHSKLYLLLTNLSMDLLLSSSSQSLNSATIPRLIGVFEGGGSRAVDLHLSPSSSFLDSATISRLLGGSGGGDGSSSSSSISSSLIDSGGGYDGRATDLPSSSSSSSLNSATVPCLLGGSGGGGGGSRTIDRHNPIIIDEKRSIRTPPNSSHPSPFTPKPSPLQQQKQRTNTKNKNSPISTATSNAKRLIGLTKTNDQRLQIHAFRKSASKLSDLTTIPGNEGGCTASKASLNCINKTTLESSRYLLDGGEDVGSGFADVLKSDFDSVLKLKVPCDQPKRSSPAPSHEVTKPKSLEGSKSSAKPPLPSRPSSSSSDHQVVVLRVSLHCRGCEGKVRKHISRMQGVTSFNIDFAAKKVTVVGDITPLQVITSISKVKNTQLLMPAASGSVEGSHGS